MTVDCPVTEMVATPLSDLVITSGCMADPSVFCAYRPVSNATDFCASWYNVSSEQFRMNRPITVAAGKVSISITSDCMADHSFTSAASTYPSVDGSLPSAVVNATGCVE